MRIAHLSDLHFGRRISRANLQALERDLMAQAPELLVVTGDLTDRGTIEQFRSAKEFFRSVGLPFISVPGNREIAVSAVLEWVLPTWLAMRRYSSFFGQMDRVVYVEESRRILFIGLNSVHWFPSWPGRISRPTRYWLRAFAAEHSSYTKILFLHHPVLPVIRASSFWAHALSDAGEVLNICTQTGFDLILQGHKHRSAVMEVNVPQRDSRIVVSCGGAPLMSIWDPVYHVIDISEQSIAVKTREFSQTDFVQIGAYEFPRVRTNNCSHSERE
ncbi:MAG: metallophosphoesterase [Desulfomonile tiedjei]|uniref:Metallophosphoesterase n=1 Tax=Desulfomonile tiedjei TaxID=2358 RepID=A0A9D6V5I1_9BACT|nr:metallophosphoesterase [Desulfomonile tiedjei]